VDQTQSSEEVTVSTADGQYRIEDPSQPVTNPWPTPTDGITTGEDGWFVVLTGVEWGPLDLTIQHLPTRPDTVLDGWEIIAERSINATNTNLNIVTTSLDLVHAVSLDVPGWYTVRAHARGRMSRLAKHHHSNGQEEHLLQLWPTPRKQTPTLLVGPDEYGKLLLR
jgi:hypothetical protein